MAHDLEKSVIRILNPQNQTVGTGFLVSLDPGGARGLAVTCAHVVDAAAAGTALTGTGRVRVGCLWAADAPANLPGTAPLEARVLANLGSPAGQEDVAFLSISFLPPGGQPVRLAGAGRSGGHSFKALGFPRPVATGFNYTRGVIVEMEQGVEGHAWLLHLQGDQLAPGMSGGPVLDETFDRVVAMVTSGPNDKYLQYAYATPVDTLQKLNDRLEVDDAERLAAQAAQAAKAARQAAAKTHINIDHVSGGQVNAAGRDLHQENRSINTGGGAYIGGNVNTGGGDFVGRDKITYGGGAGQPARLFEAICRRIDARPGLSDEDKEDLKAEIKAVQAEVGKGARTGDPSLSRHLRSIQRIDLDIHAEVLAALKDY